MPSRETAKTKSAPKKPLHVLLVDNKTMHLERLQLLLHRKLGEKTRMTLRDTRAMTEKDVRAADLVIFSGSFGRSIEKNPQTFHNMVDIVVRNKKPCIGICLGAEAIAKYYGSLLGELPVRRVGNIKLEFSDEFADEFGKTNGMVYEFHKWIIGPLYGPLECLAVSKDGPELFRHKDLPLWGMQFHPEVRHKKNIGHLVFEYILHSMGMTKKAQT